MKNNNNEKIKGSKGYNENIKNEEIKNKETQNKPTTIFMFLYIFMFSFFCFLKKYINFCFLSYL